MTELVCARAHAHQMGKNDTVSYPPPSSPLLPFLHSTMADAPTVKPWCKDDKDKLQKLIDNGKVDITKTTDTDYIDSVRHKYFRDRKVDNFRRNFRGYSCSLDIAEHYDGYQARLAAGEGVIYIRYFLLYFN